MQPKLKTLTALLLLMTPLRADEKPKAPSNPDFKLQIQADHETYFGGEPIILTVTLTNQSDRPRNIGVYGPKAEWTVKGQDGKPLSATAQGTSKSAHRSVLSQNLPAGQSLTYQVVINRYYDMTAADNYEITGQRWPIAESGTPGATTSAITSSNTIKVSVAEEDVRAK